MEQRSVANGARRWVIPAVMQFSILAVAIDDGSELVNHHPLGCCIQRLITGTTTPTWSPWMG